VWSKFAATHKAVETRQKLGEEKFIIVRGGAADGDDDMAQICDAEGEFAMNFWTIEAFAAFQSSGDEGAGSDAPYVREVDLQLVADPGKVRVHRYWFDMMRHEDDVEAESVGCGKDGAFVKFAESDVRIEGGRVVDICGPVEGTPKGNWSLMNESIKRPGLPTRLPGLGGGLDHCRIAPNASRGGWKERIRSPGTSEWACLNWEREMASATTLSSPEMWETLRSMSCWIRMSTDDLRMTL
jgi:hypothetical protein